jgi:spermidine synthase
MGFMTLIAQVVLTRELLGLFYGNELSIAFVLAVWLIAVAAGSAIGFRLRRLGPTSERMLGWSQLAAAAMLPVSLATARRVQPSSLVPGQVLGPGAMLLVSLETLAPICLLVGTQFVTAVAAVGAQRGLQRGSAISPAALTYAMEAAGSALGGLAFHIWAGQHMGPFATLAAISVLTLASACALLRPNFSPAGLRALAPACLLAGVLVLLGVRSREAEISTLRASPRWSNVNPIASAASRYGAIVVARQAGQVSLYQNGVLLFTSQDEYIDECAVHLPMLEHAAPRRILVLGGNLAGLAREALKHGVARIDCLELDPKVLESVQRWFSPSSLRVLQDPRVNLHIGDGRIFVRRAHSVYDVIIVNLPDPTTAAINRFYTAGFFEEARRALAPNGVFAIGLTGSEVQLTGPVQLAAATVDRTLAAAFPDRLIVPGERMLFLAAARAGTLTSDWRVLSDRFIRREIHADFVNQVWLRDAFLPLRAELVREAISEVPNPPLNTDLNPISYYHQTRIWLAQLSPWLSRPARLLSRMSVWWAMAAFALAALIAGISRGTRRRAAAIVIAAATMGAFGIVTEVVALLVLQSACGYLYHAMAIVMAAFMAGLAAGALLPAVRETQGTAFPPLLIALLAMATGASLLLPGLAQAALHHPGLALPALAVLLLCTGCLVGAAYPVLTVLYGRGRDVSAAAGAVYAVDLVGSAGAALLVGIVAVPLLGLAGVSLATAICLGAALLLTAISVRN